jgi:DDE family transposase
VYQGPVSDPGQPPCHSKRTKIAVITSPKQRHRVTNWAAYDIALRQRGSLTVWFTEAAIAAWKAEPRATRGGQPRYSALAITTALTLRAVFRLALRQTEGLIASLLRLLGLDLAAPDHSPISRRGETLPVSRPRPGSEANRFTCWWTAQGSSSVGVDGPRRHRMCQAVKV